MEASGIARQYPDPPSGCGTDAAAPSKPLVLLRQVVELQAEAHALEYRVITAVLGLYEDTPLGGERFTARTPESVSVPPLLPQTRVESPYLTAAEASAYLRTTVQGLYGLVKRGRVHPMPGSPGRLMFTREALDRYLLTRRRRR